MDNLDKNREFQKMIRMSVAYQADAKGVPVSEIAKTIKRSKTTTRNYIKTVKEVLGVLPVDDN